MGITTSIGWTDSTINVGWGCTKIATACANCYLFRTHWRDPSKPQVLNTGKDMKLFQRKINQSGQKIFLNSMTDTFHKDYGFEIITNWFDIMERNPDRIFQILTKRPDRMLKFLDFYCGLSETTKLKNHIWLGTSIGDKASKKFLELLKQCRQYTDGKLFISFEPLIEDLNLKFQDLDGIDWVIIGGESDPVNPREMERAWVDNIILCARIHNIPIFFKQWGGKGKDGAGGCTIYNQQIKEFPK